MLLLDIELKKKYITGSGKLSKRHLGGLNSYTDCEQVFNGLKQNEEEEKKDDLVDDSEVDVEVLAIGNRFKNLLVLMVLIYDKAHHLVIQKLHISKRIK